jgi:hypothetical protein
MASYIKSVSFDCVDALVAASFWAAALNSDVEEDSTAAKAFVEAPDWGGPDGHEFCVEPADTPS